MRLFSKLMLSGLLMSGIAGFNNSAMADSGLICQFPNSIRDSLVMTRADRPVKFTKPAGGFVVDWAAREDFSDLYFTFKFNVQDRSLAKMMLRRARYDDSLYVSINGTQVFAGVNDGLTARDVNVALTPYLKDGPNVLDMRLLNTYPTAVHILTEFDYSEGGCKATVLPKPNVPPMPDSARCVESLVCTEPKETRTFEGVDVTRDCWKWETKRSCYDFIEDKSTCNVQPTSPAGSCEIVSKDCLNEKEFNVNGNTFKGCTLYETKYQCTEPVDIGSLSTAERQAYIAEAATRRSLCKPVQTCVGENCYIEKADRDKPDSDMPYVLALLQVGQEASSYMDLAKMKIFNGTVSRCRSKRGFGALAACCEVTSPVAKNSKGQNVTPTNSETFAEANSLVNKKFDDPNASYQQDYVQAGSNPYAYDALYKPNEANYMLQGTQAMVSTKAGSMAMATEGGAASVTVMGYGYSNSGATTGDQVTFTDYSKVPNTGTAND